MARQKQEIETEQHIVTAEDAKGLPALSAAATELAGADAVIMDSFDVIKALGRIEAANFFTTVGDKLIAETAINIREGKQYKGLPYKDSVGNIRHVGDFGEFCRAFLGKSYTRTMELIGNYNVLGPDLYEQAEKIGFRQRDYNALKALPADDRQIIGMAIEEENLDKALELMQQMAVKHQNYKDATEKKLTELENTAKSKDAVIQKKDQKLNELDHELERLKLDRPVFAHVDWPAAFKGYIEQLAITRKNIKHGLGSLDVIRESAMKIEPQTEDEEAALSQAREILATELVGIHNECAEMIAALGLSFDRSLGAYSEARINLLNV
jgi:hypothetical protein